MVRDHVLPQSSLFRQRLTRGSQLDPAARKKFIVWHANSHLANVSSNLKAPAYITSRIRVTWQTIRIRLLSWRSLSGKIKQNKSCWNFERFLSVRLQVFSKSVYMEVEVPSLYVNWTTKPKAHRCENFLSHGTIMLISSFSPPELGSTRLSRRG